MALYMAHDALLENRARVDPRVRLSVPGLALPWAAFVNVGNFLKCYVTLVLT